MAHPRHLLRPAEVHTTTFARVLVVGAPVPATALIACLLAARGECSFVVGKGERRSCLQPAIPGGRSDHQRLGLLILLVGQDLTFYGRRHRCHVAHRRKLTLLPVAFRTV